MTPRSDNAISQRADTTTPDVELLALLDQAAPLLRRLDGKATARRPAPGKWSPREILGHLIDSASNNHQRFVRAVCQQDLVFPGYAQEEWVECQRYHEVAWTALVTLWEAFNRHIAHVMAATPEEVRTMPRARHNLHVIAWKPVPEHQPATLEYFMHDYVNHMRHHLRQILGDNAFKGGR